MKERPVMTNTNGEVNSFLKGFLDSRQNMVFKSFRAKLEAGKKFSTLSLT